MPSTDWYYGEHGVQKGPVSQATLADLIQSGQLPPTTLVWREGMPNWQAVSSITEFAAAGQDTPPAIPQSAFAESPKRPSVLTIFAVLNIVFGGLGLLCTPVAMVMTYFSMATTGTTPMMQTWVATSSMISIITSVMLVAFGIGLLSRKEWARKGSLACAVFLLLWAIAEMTIGVIGLTSGAMGPELISGPGLVGALIGTLIGEFSSMIYPACLAVFMNSEKIKSACK
jgi:hypothetical protein